MNAKSDAESRGLIMVSINKAASYAEYDEARNRIIFCAEGKWYEVTVRPTSPPTPRKTPSKV